MAWLWLAGPWAGQGRGDVAVALEGRGAVAMGQRQAVAPRLRAAAGPCRDSLPPGTP